MYTMSKMFAQVINEIEYLLRVKLPTLMYYISKLHEDTTTHQDKLATRTLDKCGISQTQKTYILVGRSIRKA